MDRFYDPYLFHATAVGVDWAAVAKLQGRQAEVDTTPSVQLRWMVNAAIGLPPGAFTVWRRSGAAKLQNVEVGQLYGDGFVSSVLPEPMVSVEVDITPDTTSSSVMLSGFVDAPSPTTLAAVRTQTPGGPTTLLVRGSGLRQFVTTGGTVTAVRGETVRAALESDWKPYEAVGLPVDGSWNASRYSTQDQGFFAGPVPPDEAARQRMLRGLAPFGWAPWTATGRTVAPWAAPDPARYVAAVQAQTLDRARPLFAAGVAPADQAAIKPVQSVPGPTSQGASAAGTSTMGVPLLGTLLVGPGNDSAAALALGFGTAYPATDRVTAVLAVTHSDFMVTASYPDGIGTNGTGIELAVVLPWPGTVHRPPGHPTSLIAERAGLLLPASDVAPWTETVRLAFDRVPISVAMERPTVAALARYPAAPAPADLTLEPDPAGGWRPLLLTARPDPNAGQVALVDSVDTELPVNLSARTIGHAVAVADVYGLWSSWADVSYASSSPPYPIPQVVSARAEPIYAGAPTCPTTVTLDLVVDWAARIPAALEVRIATSPVAYSGAPLPSGVGPYGVPTGSALRTISLGVSGARLLPPSADVSVQYLTADGTGVVDPSDPSFPAATRSAQGDSRRYRLTVTNWLLDFAATAHYAVAGWARELTTVPGAPWGDVAAQPVVAYAGSPVPPAVAFTAPLVVPLGSLPDADNASHVVVSTGGISGAVSVSVWSVSETRLRTAAGLAPQADPSETLPTRYAQLQAAYDSLSGSAQRAPFTRSATYPNGSSSVDFALPRGSKEIALFAVTAVNAAGVESAWPTSHGGLQAAAAPTVVTPTMPVVSAALDPDGSTITVMMTSRCALPIIRFELYATRVAAAAANVATMGPPLTVVAVPPVAPDPTAPAPGPAVTATVAALAVGTDWRPLRLRAVAVAVEHDNDSGTYGARSIASPVAVIASQPMTPPDLSALTLHGWGTDGTGVRVGFSSALPLDVGTLTVTARNGSTPIFTGGGNLAALGLADLSVTPATAATGVVLRGGPTAGVTPYEAWFVRPTEGTPIEVDVVLRDALGRVSVRTANLVAGAIDPPVITVLSSWVSGAHLLAEWTTDTPPDDGTGPCVLTIAGSGARFFPPLGPRPLAVAAAPLVRPAALTPFRPPRVNVSGTFPMTAIRDASVSPLQPIDVDVVRTTTAGHPVYTSAVRVPRPGSMTLSIATPGGQVGTARINF